MNNHDMEMQEEKTTRLSEDPRFIEQVSKQLKDYFLRKGEAAEQLAKRGRHFKRGASERLGEMGLLKAEAFAREYELCLVKQSRLPGTLRLFVSSIGGAALGAYAQALAQENNQEKEGGDETR